MASSYDIASTHLYVPGTKLHIRNALTHGATVGQLDESVLFYLRSRGIGLEVARRMLVQAFCAVALRGIEPAPLRERCEALLVEQSPAVAA